MLRKVNALDLPKVIPQKTIFIQKVFTSERLFL